MEKCWYNPPPSMLSKFEVRCFANRQDCIRLVETHHSLPSYHKQGLIWIFGWAALAIVGHFQPFSDISNCQLFAASINKPVFIRDALQNMFLHLRMILTCKKLLGNLTWLWVITVLFNKPVTSSWISVKSQVSEHAISIIQLGLS